MSFMRENNMAQILPFHKNIVRSLEYAGLGELRLDGFESREVFFIETELCTGGELFDKIVNEGPIGENDARKMFK